MATTDSATLLQRSGRPGQIPTGKADYAIVLLLLALCVFQVVTVQRVERYSSDSSAYITVARNIFETGRYEANFKSQTLYPPGFPLLLAGISLLTGSGSFDTFVRFMPVLSTLALMVWYFLLRQKAGRSAAGASCLLVATCLPLYQLVTQTVLSDSAFLLSSGLALWCLTGLERPDLSRLGRFALFGLAVLFTVATVSIRSAGIALSAGMLAWLLAALWGGGPTRPAASRAAVCALLAGFLALAAWIGWTRQSVKVEYPGEFIESYSAQFGMKDPYRPALGKASAGDLVLRAASNVPIQTSHTMALFTRMSWIAPVWHSPLTLIPFVLLLAGLASFVLENRGTLIGGYFLAYFGVYLLWPYDEGPRYMLSVAPVSFVLLWRGFTFAGRSMRTITAARLAWLAGLAAAVAIGAALTRAPGLQPKASLGFWLLTTIALATLAWMVRRAGPARVVLAGDRLIRWFPRRVPEVTVAVLSLVGLFQLQQAARANLAPDPTRFTHYPAVHCAAWLRTAGEGVVMAQQSQILHRLSGRKVANFPITNDPRIIMGSVQREGVRYLVVNDPLKYEYFFPTEGDRYSHLELAHPHLFQLVQTGPGYRVFELRR